METNYFESSDYLQELSEAMFNASFPCNPIPFINGLNLGIKLNGMDWINTNQAKRILFIIISLSYNQFFNLDNLEEYIYLKNEYEETRKINKLAS